MALLNRRWWYVVVFCLALLIALQVGSGIYVKQRSAQLYATLNEAQTLSLGLTQSLGYGGLIHHFKNQVLRPDETRYAELARASAEKANSMIQALEAKAREIGISASLNATQTMVATYSERLEQLPALVARGLRPGEIDPEVRFDDREALDEIQGLLGQVQQAVRAKVDALTELGSLLFWLSSGTMAVLVLFLVSQLIKRRRDLKAIELLNGQLNESVKRLEESNVALKQFAGIVSHDLKAPLRHIGFFGTLISEDVENAEDVKKHITSIDEAIGRMDNLIESLLDFTKTGFAEPKLEPVQIRQIAANAIDELQPQVEASKAVISLALSGTINADSSLLCRVFENLIGNSIKYARKDVPPRIEIRSTSDEKFLHLSFTDNGIGIPAKYAERVFVPFQRLHTSKDEYEGNGIGLALVKTVVEAHAGAVRIDTDYTDGTRIIISLLKTPTITGKLPEKASVPVAE